MDFSNLSRSEKIHAIELIEEKKRLQQLVIAQTYFDMMYIWQLTFIKATATYYECCLCAANQIGKTFLGTLVDAVHLLGDYPEDWPGHKFDFPPTVWALGYSMEKTRDLIQTAIFGKLVNGNFQGGLVPAERIVSHESAPGTPNACRSVVVKHSSGDESVIQFWSYSQGQHAIMGDVVDWVHIDEEPKDQTIRPQVLTRTINGDKGKGGRVIYTFTPENGKTDLVLKFMDDPTKDQFFMKKGWKDAPHMDKEKQERVMAQYPKHQRKMRTEGEPMLGSGRIYDVSDDLVLCDPFIVPDHFWVLNAMDFGWDHPQAHIQMVWDKDLDIIYVVKAWKKRESSAATAWGAVKDWAEGVPTAWPPDGLQNEKGREDAVQQKLHYAKAGFKMLPGHACWPDTMDEMGDTKRGGSGVEQGVYEINERAGEGKFKIFSNLFELIDEFNQYHRTDDKIVKTKDDLLDAVRYSYMMRRFAVRVGMTSTKPVYRMPPPLRVMGTGR